MGMPGPADSLTRKSACGVLMVRSAMAMAHRTSGLRCFQHRIPGSTRALGFWLRKA
ncbi:hypothetical protein MPLDJ20_60145 [Mesorhizobium plurifarium]|uniref:Uncharacterized protein n=1 Tax=Mesorhizobium plurifarium TaxID=69974 RepID=A0A090GPX1_MESPL|nr:hypothetical protein MPLDJ20_60145 [Mesorhizobium plurifarium]CDX63339.1 hypothetical protein MPL3365_90024 [Mesorhizobium plurifarium]